MADNTQVNNGTGDTVRDKDRAGIKTQILGLDLGIGTATEELAERLADKTASGANTDLGILAVGIGPGWDRKRDPANLGTVIGNTSVLGVDGADVAMVFVGTTTTGTFTIEVTADDTAWIAADAVDTQTDTDVTGTNLTPTSGKTYLVRVAAFRQFRIKTVATLGASMAHKFTTHSGQFWSMVGGTVAHDSPDGGKPIKIGGRAIGAAPAVVADGDRVNAWYDTRGAGRVNETGAQSVATGQVTPTASAATLIAARTGRKNVKFYNGTNMTVYVGPATVSTANGWPILPGGGVVQTHTALVQIIVASATGLTGVVAYEETFES